MQCWNVSAVDNSSSASSDRFNISNSCALFDFALYTVGVGTMVMLGVAGNSLSFVVLLAQSRDTSRGRDTSRAGRPVSRYRTSASDTSFLLRALAAADTVTLLAAVPLYVLPPIYPLTGYLDQYYQLYLTILPFLWPIYLIPFTGSVFITVLVSVDRYLAVCRPFGSGVGLGKFSGPLSARRVRCLITALAVVAVIYNVPRFFEYQRVEECIPGVNATRVGFEITEFGAHLLYRIVYANVLYFVVVHGGPLLALGFFNVRLMQALRRRHRRRLEMTAAAAGEHGVTRAQRDVTMTLVGVICVFILCQTPTLVDHVLWTVVDSEERQCGGWHYFYTAVGDALAVLNSSVNFVVYVLTSHRFRRDLLVALRCARDRSADVMTETTCGPATVIACRSSARQRALESTEPLTTISVPAQFTSSQWRSAARRQHSVM